MPVIAGVTTGLLCDWRKVRPRSGFLEKIMEKIKGPWVRTIQSRPLLVVVSEIGLAEVILQLKVDTISREVTN